MHLTCQDTALYSCIQHCALQSYNPSFQDSTGVTAQGKDVLTGYEHMQSEGHCLRWETRHVSFLPPLGQSFVSVATGTLCQVCFPPSILYLTVWGVETVVTHQTSWLESTGVDCTQTAHSPAHAQSQDRTQTAHSLAHAQS